YPPLLIDAHITITGNLLHAHATDRDSTFEDRLVIKSQHSIDVVTPEVQGQLLLLLYTQLGLFQEDHYQPIQRVYLIGAQVVLGDDDILLSYPRTTPTGQCHIGLTGIRALQDQLGGGVIGGGIKQLVLHFGKEQCGFTLASLVIRTKLKQIANLLIKALLRGPYVADAL